MDTKLLFFSTCLVVTALFFSSCKTYYIPTESFKQQFCQIDSDALVPVRTRGPAGDIAEYMANPIRDIHCVDKKNNSVILKNSPSIEIRFTEHNDKKTILYFDMVYVEDSVIYGDGSRFIFYEKSIPIENVKKIEVQDGRKKFKYVY